MVIIAVVFALLQTPQPPAATGANVELAGVWTLNTELSDRGRGRGDDSGDRGGDRDSGRRGGYGGRGGFGGGRGGGGRGMGRGGMRGEPVNPEAAARMREAMRDLMEPSERLTIVQTGAMVLVTGADGRTIRLSTDGKKIKDENTGVERKTKWDAGKLVSEINGLGRGKATQTFFVDPETHRLHITVQMEGGRSRQPRTIDHVYDKGDHD